MGFICKQPVNAFLRNLLKIAEVHKEGIGHHQIEVKVVSFPSYLVNTMQLVVKLFGNVSKRDQLHLKNELFNIALIFPIQTVIRTLVKLINHRWIMDHFFDRQLLYGPFLLRLGRSIERNHGRKAAKRHHKCRHY